MKVELVAAVARLVAFGSEALADGLTETHAKTQEVLDGLVPMLVRVELMEELWEVAKLFAAMADGPILDSRVYSNFLDLCRKVAAADTTTDGH